MIIRVRFYDELCKVENSVILFSLYDKIYNGEIEFGEIVFETYDVDKMWGRVISHK